MSAAYRQWPPIGRLRRAGWKRTTIVVVFPAVRTGLFASHDMLLMPILQDSALEFQRQKLGLGLQYILAGMYGQPPVGGGPRKVSDTPAHHRPRPFPAWGWSPPSAL